LYVEGSVSWWATESKVDKIDGDESESGKKLGEGEVGEKRDSKGKGRLWKTRKAV
jgi:hypothetical protein